MCLLLFLDPNYPPSQRHDSGWYAHSLSRIVSSTTLYGHGLPHINPIQTQNKTQSAHLPTFPRSCVTCSHWGLCSPVMELGLADTFQSLSWHFHSTWHSRMFFFIELSLLLFLINVFPWFFSSYLLPHFLLRHCASPNYWCNGDVLSLVPSSCHSAHGPWAILPTPVAVTSTCHWLPNIFYLQKILQSADFSSISECTSHHKDLGINVSKTGLITSCPVNGFFSCAPFVSEWHCGGAGCQVTPDHSCLHPTFLNHQEPMRGGHKPFQGALLSKKSYLFSLELSPRGSLLGEREKKTVLCLG